MSRPLYAQINLAAMRSNLARVREQAPGTQVLAVVKANAYGHGLMDGSEVAAAVARGELREVRDYCETDVVNTMLLYQRFRLIRGELTAEEYAAEIALVRDRLSAADAPHWKAFVAAWDAS